MPDVTPPPQQKPRQAARATRLPPQLTIETAETLATLLSGIKPKKTGQALVDASAVTHMHTPGLQLLLALQKKLAADGVTLTVTNPSPAFSLTCHDTGAPLLMHDGAFDA